MEKGLGIGVILMAAIAIIVGLTMFQGNSQNMGVLTQTQTATNVTYTTPANGSYVTLAGQATTTTPVVSNATYTYTSGVEYLIASATVNGQKVLRLQSIAPNMTAPGTFNITYSYEPVGYVSDSGSRTVANLIPVFFALAIMAVGLIAATPILREKFGF